MRYLGVFNNSVHTLSPSAMKISYICLNLGWCKDFISFIRALLITDNKVYRALLRKSMFVKQNIDFSFLGLIVFLSIFYSSCNTARYLHSDESLLKGTKIVYKNEKNVSDKSSLTNEILQLIDYKPNGKSLFLIPEEWMYLSNIRSGKDSSWYNKAFSKLGAPPVLYDEGKHKIIASNIENYLRFRKGYYEARVDFITKEKSVGWTSSKGSATRFDTEVSYIVSTGDRYRINSITYESEDKSLLRFIQSVNDETLIRKNDYIDFLVIEEEKKRLVLELQNNGYAGFAGNYIELNGDSSRTVSYTHLRAHETVLDLVCRLLLEKKKKSKHYNHLILR